MTNKPLSNHIALITGASRGIGRAVAKRLAGEGAKLILVARTSGGLEELDDEIIAAGGEQSTIVPLDLQNYASIDELGSVINDKYGRLDILIGNAGILGAITPINHLDPDVWQKTIDINLTANYRLIRSMHPLLEKSDAGRAIFVSSGAASGAYAYWGGYAVSKAGLEMLVKIYAAENEKTNICANLINPGAVATSMRSQAFPGEDPDSLNQPADVTELFLELSLPTCTKNGELLI